MAEAASSKKQQQQQQQHSTLCGQNITDCILEPDEDDDDDANNDNDAGDDDDDVHSLPVTLRIFFDPSKHLAFFRLYTTICCDIDSRPTPTQLFLDIVPDKIHMLSLSHPRLRLRFRLKAPGSITVIAPITIPSGQLKPAIPSAQAALTSLRYLSQLSAIRITLDRVVVQDLDLDLPLQACCEALSSQHLFVSPLHPDPIHTSLRSLYRGAGGRVVQVDKELPAPLPWDQPASPPAAPPPAYDDNILTTPKTSKGKNKRLRIHSPTTSSTSSSPDASTFGQREKRMAELIRCADKRHAALTKLLVETESATLYLQATLKNAAAGQRCRNHEKEGQAEVEEEEKEVATTSITSLAAPPASSPVVAPASSPAAASISSTTNSSRASTLSDRFQTLITPHLDQLRNEITAMLQGYITADDVDAILTDDRFVREDAMFEAIEQVVEENMDQVRDRIRDAFL